ncbi:MAG TPA: type III pantothenate kinase [Oceanospirillaceae bacterium]|nr:type III pantothenate kinase [Oceanospirillaceae bacterium]
MLLLVDIGNTRFKWRLQASVVATEVVARGSLMTAHLTSAQLREQLPVGVAVCGYTSVASEEVNDLLVAWAHDSDVDVAQALTQNRWQDLVNSYSDCTRMGVDRWLAMVAVRNLTKQAACVIDCGSASTVDFIAPNGEHEGGYIIPGQRLMVQSLLQDTAHIAFTEHECEATTGYGTSTAGAVLKGASRMHEAGIGAIANDALQHGYVVYATGGDGCFLAQVQGIHWLDELVLDGLKACLYDVPGLLPSQ